MYYTVKPGVCQPLFAGRDVAFKQQSAEQADAPSGGPINSMDAVYSANQAPVPQHEHRPAEQEAEQDNEGDSADDGSEDVHINL